MYIYICIDNIIINLPCHHITMTCAHAGPDSSSPLPWQPVQSPWWRKPAGLSERWPDPGPGEAAALRPETHQEGEPVGPVQPDWSVRPPPRVSNYHRLINPSLADFCLCWYLSEVTCPVVQVRMAYDPKEGYLLEICVCTSLTVVTAVTPSWIPWNISIHNIRNDSFHTCQEMWRSHYLTFIMGINRCHTCLDSFEIVDF